MRLNKDTIGEGRDLLLLHGWGLNSAVWRDLVDGLKDDYRLTLMDLPGFGINHNKLPQQYDLTGLTTLIAEQLDRPTLVLGWSLGGLLSGLIKPSQSLSTVLGNVKAEVLAAFASQLHSDVAKTIDRFLAIQALGSDKAKTDILALRSLLAERPLPHPRALREGLKILQQADLRQQIRHIGCPTLRVYGRRDSLVPAAAMEKTEVLHPASTSMLFPTASHAPFISHSEEFVLALKEWLEAMPA